MITSNSVHNNGGGSPSASIQNPARTYRTGNSTLTLREGQTLKGVVSDIHGNELTLSMEDGSSFTGKLPDANQYSIGQKAAFQIVSLSDNTIYMKATTGAYLLDMEDTIEQALEEAGLPKSERNLDVVRSLLQNQQSISRQNIMSSIQLCAKYPEADVNSVITMNRLGMSLSPSSVKQFENYQNQTHQLLYKMDTLSTAISDMLHSIGTQVPRLARDVGTQLLSLALEGEPTLEEQQLETALAPQTETGNENLAASEGAAENTTALQEEATLAEESTLAEEATLAEETTQTEEQEVASKNTPESETAKASQEAGQTPEGTSPESARPFARMRQFFNAITDSNAAARNAMAASGMAEDFRTPFIHEQTGFILPPDKRAEFAKEIEPLPLPEELKSQLADGTLTARKFLSEIQKAFPEMTDEQAGKLLSSKSFHAIVKGQFMSNWTISPEQLKEENSLQDMYTKMSQQFKALSHFSEQVLGKDIFTDVSNSASDMNENLDFMRMLNETFQYVQLPIKLQNQNAHGDLYVMTKKESLKKDPRHLKVLLHLDMENLGTLDIHIAREDAIVTTKFFVSTEETLHLLEKNINLLEDAINGQGYLFHSELSMKQKNVDVVNDFVGAEAPVGDIKRYNFDLRA